MKEELNPLYELDRDLTEAELASLKDRPASGGTCPDCGAPAFGGFVGWPCTQCNLRRWEARNRGASGTRPWNVPTTTSLAQLRQERNHAVRLALRDDDPCAVLAVREADELVTALDRLLVAARIASAVIENYDAIQYGSTDDSFAAEKATDGLVENLRSALALVNGVKL